MVFFAALKASTEVEGLTEGRIYNTAIPGTDDDVDNEPVPYIVVTYDGMNNEEQTKDDPYEGDTDIVSIGVEITANDREQLAALADSVRVAVSDFVANYQPEENDANDLTDELPEGFTVSAQAVMYDPWKPCYYQVLNWRCETKRIDYE